MALLGKKSAVAETPEQGSSGKMKQNRQEKQPRKKLNKNRGNTDSSSSDSEQHGLDLKRLGASASRPPPSSQPSKTAGSLSIKEYSQRAPVDDQLRASLSMAKTSVEGGQDQTEAYLWRKKISEDKLWPRKHGSDAFRCVSYYG